MEQKRLIRECVHATKGDSLKFHFHDDFEIIYVKKGSARIFINEGQYLLKRGSIVFIGRLEEHSVEILSKDYERYYIIPRSELLEQVVADPRLISIFRSRPLNFRYVLNLAECSEELDIYFAKIAEEFDNYRKYSDQMIVAQLMQILISVYRNSPEEFNFSNKMVYPEIYRIQQYIENNHMNDIKISDIASEHFISIHYLSRCFKALTGYSPKQYLTNIRIARAKTLLGYSSISVKDIAVKCGFNDINNFIRTFKEVTGVTPYKYRTTESNT